MEDDGPRRDDTASCSLISSMKDVLRSAVVGSQSICGWEILMEVWNCYEASRLANRERT